MLKFSSDPPATSIKVKRDLAYAAAQLVTSFPSYGNPVLKYATFFSPGGSPIVSRELDGCSTYYDKFYCFWRYGTGYEYTVSHISIAPQPVTDPYQGWVVVEYSPSVTFPAKNPNELWTWNLAMAPPSTFVSHLFVEGLGCGFFLGWPGFGYWYTNEKKNQVVPLDCYFALQYASTDSFGYPLFYVLAWGKVAWTTITDVPYGNAYAIYVEGSAELTDFLVFREETLADAVGLSPCVYTREKWLGRPMIGEPVAAKFSPLKEYRKIASKLYIPYDFK